MLAMAAFALLGFLLPTLSRASLTDRSHTSSNATLACSDAQVALGAGSVDTAPVSPTLVDLNWSETCWTEPACVIKPKSTKNVAATLSIVSRYQVKFAVRSGGHSPNPGWSSISSDGILIDLSRLDQITVSSDNTTVSVGPGQRWGNVLAALDPYGVSVIGGRTPTVGVGGLVLGGGYFHFSGEHGLAADNVKNFEIVLGNGTITNANAKANSDLFWALKGGGPNFGIVTRFNLYTIPVHDIYYDLVLYSADQIPGLLDAFASWQNGSGGVFDVKGTVAMIVGLEYATVGFIYSSPQTKRPAAFDAFAGIPVMTVVIPPSNGTVWSLTQIIGAATASAVERHDYLAAASQVDGRLYNRVYNFWKERAADVYAKTGANQTFVIQPVPLNLVQQGIAKGGNALGLPLKNMQWWTTLVDWQNAADDDTARSVSIATSEEWKKGSDINFLYMNDCARDQNPLAGYGRENIAKLKAVSRKYDRGQVFQRLQNDGFLLRKV
ncbi:bifunctional solanapyrone synthase [Diplogelasinospora grovesii]|uniref:Bifunctional solanapyrone synthase n=1 Tax=Diplogelasinospora grovesii TaxID=303347 RepID=A0AAN6MZH7_9PEZI|nr:bifunctional solanapyrone synthase [Diplogelasinospora grovesii]